MLPSLISYHSYLLRIWQEKDDPRAWRASLQEVRSGQVWGFTSPEQLIQHLEQIERTAQGNNFENQPLKTE
jgi:hypothetical protein